MLTWTPHGGARVSLSEVEEAVFQAAASFSAPVIIDLIMIQTSTTTEQSAWRLLRTANEHAGARVGAVHDPGHRRGPGSPDL